jgi:CheY-like chemotaxis protein/predicted Ser/Thr protein kinase
VAALVADDEPVVREVIVEILRGMGFGRIDEAVDGADAKAKVATGGYQLLLLDLAMPGAPGDVVLAEALRADPEMVVVIVTGHATIDNAVELMKQGAADLVRKPFDQAILRAKVASALARAADRRAATGTTRFGRYEIRTEIARGGVGIVYRATDTETGDTVALKILQSGTEATEEQVLRFHREAKTVQELRHPNIVAVRDFGSVSGRHFIVMDYVDGRPLDALIAGGELTLKRALRIEIGAAHALHYAHEREILHRDVKPSNILVDADWRPHLIDFGLARFVRDAKKVTRARRIHGTFGYIAPERFRGDHGEGDARADVFSLGVVLYEMLTGAAPYPVRAEANFLPDFSRLPTPPTVLNPELPAELSDVTLSAVAAAPGDRPATARALATDLEAVMRGVALDFRLKYRED